MKNLTIKYIVSIWIYLITSTTFSVSLYAQDIKFEHINRDNGLPINSVTCMDQDKDGFIWMGSMYGLVKYDGTNFKAFSYDYADSTTIPGYLVTQLKCTDDGKIYLALTANGISILDPKTEKFRTFEPEHTKNFSGINVNAMVLDSIGNFWIGTETGLHYFNTKTLTFSNYLIKNPFAISDSSNNYEEYISSIAIDNNNNLYLLGHNSSLLYFNTQTKEIRPISYSNKQQESLFLFSSGQLFIDNMNKVWIGTENNGIFVYDPLQNEKTKHLLAGTIITSIKNINGNIWVGTDGKGVFILNESYQVISKLKNNPIDPFSLSSNTIYCINQTKDHTIWVGTYLTGVNLYNASRHKFSTISITGEDNRRLTNRTVLCLEAINDSILFIGTDGGGINTVNLTTGIIKPLKSKNGVLDKIVAKSIAKYNDESFFLGTYSEGLFYCKINNDFTVSAVQINRKNKDRYNHIWSLYVDSDTSVWIGYLHSGISIYNPQQKTYKNLPRYKDHNIHFIKRINNEIWTSSEQKGLFRSNIYGDLIHFHENDGKDPESLVSNFVLEVFTDSKGRIWLGTNTTGLSVITDIENGKFKNINSISSFPANMVSNIEEDENGLLWISTNNGIVRFNPENYNAELFDRKDGLQGKQFNINSSFNYKNKTLYFGGVDGLSCFQPDQIKRNAVLPHVVFTGLKIGNEQIKVGELRNNSVILDKPISYKKQINLSHKDEDFTIEFSALHYESSSKNQYKYMLEGFDHDWITAKPGQLSARYTNLKKGEFVFKVKAANPDNYWNQTPTELVVSIKPPFYFTIGFYLLFSLFIVIIIVLYTKWRTYKLEADKKKLKELVNLKTIALQEKANLVIEQNEEIKSINNQLQEFNITRDKIFSILAHDLRSPLNAISSFSKMIEKEYDTLSKEKVIQFNGIIGQTSLKMNDLITNLLHWVNSQVGKIEPQFQVIQLNSTFQELEEFTNANALQKEISITFNSNNALVYADNEMLVITLRNLISNSIKFTPSKGYIDINAINANNKTIIKISDSGVGMSIEQIKTIEKRETLLSTKGTANESGTGLGLFLCQDFAKKNNGSFSIESQPNKGTTVTLTFPSSKNNAQHIQL